MTPRRRGRLPIRCSNISGTRTGPASAATAAECSPVPVIVSKDDDLSHGTGPSPDRSAPMTPGSRGQLPFTCGHQEQSAGGLEGWPGASVDRHRQDADLRRRSSLTEADEARDSPMERATPAESDRGEPGNAEPGGRSVISTVDAHGVRHADVQIRQGGEGHIVVVRRAPGGSSRDPRSPCESMLVFAGRP